MTDVTSHTPGRYAARRGQGAEYAVYFGAIFVTALAFAVVSCLRDLALGNTRQWSGPLARARRDAGRITPMIFSA
ncbi:protein pufQ [Sagittula sp. NFXS13]|uniref:cytochrome PufQ n=1 Tax=Sagittula sp. NFXS13 TaxID=2819095 RepID=UPI0032E03E7F